MKQRHQLPLIILSTILTVGLFSCTKDNEPSSQNTPIWPMAIGNEWVYIDSTHNMYSWHTNYDTILINGKATINGVTGYYSQKSSNPSDPISGINSDDQGNCIFVGAYSSLDTILLKSVYLKNYPKFGETWIFHQADYDRITGFKEDTLSVTCEGIDIPVKTPLGTFTCNVYSNTYYSGTNNQDVDKFVNFFARGIGRVKSIHYENGYIQSNSTLIKYTVK